MPDAVIFANGSFHPPQSGRPWHGDGSLLIAADGGAEHCLALGLTPDILIGDFDSLSTATLQRLTEHGTQVIRYPTDKDATDLELAIELAISRGLNDIAILGAVGDRWDQSLASFLLLERYAPSTHSIVMLDGIQEAFLIRAGERRQLIGRPGDIVSLIPLTDDASGITTSGLAYPLSNGRLAYGSTRGVSNVLKAGPASVQLEDGVLVCIISHISQVEA